MTAPFDWAGLWDAAWKAWDDAPPSLEGICDRDAAEVLRTRIEAAFVPAWQHKATCMGYSLDVEEATARIEAAEARVKVLEEALQVCANAPLSGWTIAQGYARQALGGEHE